MSVVHLSTAEGLSEARRARARGQEVYLETCPQYLLLTEDCYAAPDGEKYVMSPPLRTEADKAALWAALAAGEIDYIGTDHCSFTMAQKRAYAHDFARIPNGGAGVQHRGQLLYTYGVCAGRIALEQMVQLLAAGPARCFGMDGRGAVAPGMAADVVVWDPGFTGVITDTGTAHNCDNSPFAGLAVRGRAREVLLNGQHVVAEGALIAPGCGRYIPRKGYGRCR